MNPMLFLNNYNDLSGLIDRSISFCTVLVVYEYVSIKIVDSVKSDNIL